MLAILGAASVFLLEAVTVEMGAIQPAWNAGVPRSVIVFVGSDEAASSVKPGMILCMLKQLLNAPAAPGRANADGHRAL